MKTLLASFILLGFNPSLFASDYYWVGNGGNWSDFANHWATTPGGSTMQTNVPSENDNVFFDVNSFSSASQVVVFDLPINECRTINFTGISNTPTINSPLGNELKVSRDWISGGGFINDLLGLITFNSASGSTIASGGVDFVSDVLFDGFGSWTLTDIFTTSQRITVKSGTINSDNFGINCLQLFANGFEPRGLNAGTSIITISGNDSAFVSSPLNFFFDLDNAQLIFNSVVTSSVDFYSQDASFTFPTTLVYAANFEVKDNSSFANLTLDLGSNLILPANKTIDVINLIAAGNCTLPNSILSSDSIEVSTLNIPGGWTSSFNIIEGIQATGGTFIANNSIDRGRNAGWTINNAISAGDVFWIGGNGNWSNPLNWSNNCLPGPNDTVIFNAGSFNAGGQSVTVDIEAYCYAMKWVSVTNLPNLAGTDFPINIKNELILHNAMTSTFSGNFVFDGDEIDGSITTNNVTIAAPILINGLGTFQFLDNFTSFKGISVRSGNLAFDDHVYTFENLYSTGNIARSIDLDSANITLTGYGNTIALENSALTMTTSSSKINLTNQAIGDYSDIRPAGFSFDTLFLNNLSTRIFDNASFKYVYLSPSTSLEINNGVTLTLDSLSAIGNCNEIINVSSINSSGAPATISKQGFDTVYVDYLDINNLTATSAPNPYFVASNSTVSASSTGWTSTGLGLGTVFYWRGDSGNWSDVSKWESPLGIPATCLPRITDTVYFDGLSFTLPGQSVIIDKPAYAFLLDATGSGLLVPSFSFNNKLKIRKDLIADPGIAFNSNGNIATIIFEPIAEKGTFLTANNTFNLSIVVNGMSSLDTLQLLSNLIIGDEFSLTHNSGTFHSNGDSIFAGSFFAFGGATGEINIENSYLNIKENFTWDNGLSSTTTASKIVFAENTTYALFEAQGHLLNDIELMGSPLSLIGVNKSNSFNNLTINKGSNIVFESAQSQSILSALVANGECETDTIYLGSSTVGSPALINCSSPQTINVSNLSYINASGSSIDVLFGKDKIANTNVNFLATNPTNPDFSTSFDNCLGTAAVFTNSSTDYLGGTAINYEWNFGDGNTSTLATPSHTYLDNDLFYVNLKTTYTNGCYDTKLDSIRVNDAEIFFSSTEIDSALCIGDVVDFSVISTGANNFEFFLNTSSVQNGGLTNYSTSTLNNEDSVRVRVTLNGCPKMSETLPFIVNNLPSTILQSSDADNILCDGDSIYFSGTGAEKYQFKLDGTPTGSFLSDDTWSTNNLTNGQTITLTGLDSTTGCLQDAPQIITITVNPNPVPTVSHSDADMDLVICQGDNVTFTASGANEYEFFVNNTSQQGSLANPSYTTNSLNLNDVVTVIGTKLGCSIKSADSTSWFVNPIPVISVTNNSSNDTICEQENILFSATGGSFYEFLLNGATVQGPSGSNTYSNSNFNQGDIVEVLGTQSGCTGSSPNLTVRVLPLPIVTFNSSDIDDFICFGENVSFDVSGADSYTYFVAGSPYFGPTTSLTYTTDSIMNGQNYTVLGNLDGCENLSASNYLFTVEAPINLNFTYSESLDTICEGDDVSFFGFGSGVTQYDIESNGTLIQNNASGNFNSVILASGLNTIRLAGSRNGCIAYADTTFSIYVTPLPTISLTSSDLDQIICSKDSVLFEANGAFEYEFFVDGFTQGLPTTRDSLLLGGIINGQTISVKGFENGCEAFSTTTFTFTVNPNPVVNLISSDVDNIICEGEPVTFDVNGATEYQYNVNGNPISIFSINDQYNSDTIYNGDLISVQGISNNCLSAPQFLSFTVNGLPTPTLTPNETDTSSCEGEVITIAANGASLYEFFVDNVSTNPSSTNSIFSSSSLLDGQTVTVIGTSSFGCSGVSLDMLTYNITPSPTINVSVSTPSDTICAGDLVDFEVTGADSVNYYLNGNFIYNQFNYSSDSLLNGDLIVINGFSNGCSTQADSAYQFRVFNYPIVALEVLDSDTNICEGDELSFVGYGAPFYEFLLDGLSQGVQTNDTLIFPNLIDGQTVSLIGSNYGCESNSQLISVNVNPIPNPILSLNPTSTNVCYGTPIIANANGATEYQFFINNIPVSGIGGNQFTINDISGTPEFTVIGYNGSCSDTSAISSIIIDEMNLELFTSPSNMLCDGSSATFIASGANEYSFYLNGSLQQGPGTNNSYTVSNVSNEDVISMAGTNNLTGCIQDGNNDQLMVILNNPTVTPPGPLNGCEGDEFTLESDYSTWNQWFLNGIGISGEQENTFTATESGTYQTAIQLGGNGEVLSIGNNIYGQLGDETYIGSLVTKQAANLTSIRNIASGRYHTLAIDSANILYGWGRNDFGQLGDTTYGDKNFPIKILENVVQVVCGDKFSAALMNDSTVMTWGENTFGQLGNGNSATTNIPAFITIAEKIVQIDAGANHIIALSTTGKIYAWGNNANGQFGNGTLNSNAVPQATGIVGINKIKCGFNHSFCIDSSGQLFAWGNNSNGQLGIGVTGFQNIPHKVDLLNVKSIDGGDAHSIATTTNGNIYTWGSNSNGQLGNGTNVAELKPRLISNLNNAKKVIAGFSNTAIIRGDQSVWTFGRNTNGQLGSQDLIDQYSPLHVIELTGASDLSLSYQHISSLATSEASCLSNGVNVTIESAPEVLIIVVDSIFFSSEMGIGYQWYLNGNPILVNGNNQSYVPSQPGLYSVEVTYNNGCIVESNDYPFSLVNDLTELLENLIEVYPNPASDRITVQSSIDLNISIHDTYGRIVYQDTSKTRLSIIDLSNIAPGSYLIVCKSDEAIVTKKIIIL